MARKILTLYDVPDSVRARGAAEARRQLRLLQQNPHLTSTQKKDLAQRVQWCAKWEALQISEVLPPPPPQVDPLGPTEPPQALVGTHHNVLVTETLSVEEDV